MTVLVTNVIRGVESVTSAKGTSFVIALGDEVDASSSIVRHSNSIPSGATRDLRHVLTMELEASVSATPGYYDQIRVRRAQSSFAITFDTAWEVTEFDPASLGPDGVNWNRVTGLSAASTTYGQSISVTDVDSAVLLMAWTVGGNIAMAGSGSVRGSITSTSNLDLITGANADAGLTVVWQTIDFDPADVEVQRGSITVTGISGTPASNDDAIAAVDLDATLLIGAGVTYPVLGTVTTARAAFGLQFSDSTHVTAYIGLWGGDAGKTMTANYQAVQFLDGAEVYAGVAAFGTGDTSYTSPTFSPALDEARTAAMPLSPDVGNVEIGSGNPSDQSSVSFRHALDISGSDVNSITLTRNTTGSIAVNSWYQVIQFATATAASLFPRSRSIFGARAGSRTLH